ncbi:AMP-binding protein [Oceanicola sp. 22II-s10i]|uniref:AMP-binding protein n=1 Tax=Oceanicola sp. 22II-s10i TaxID=1317116 RepID=UPI000B523A54|nr:AMP-binding protein [Oceanicola sp. 22II-s10i]
MDIEMTSPLPQTIDAVFAATAEMAGDRPHFDIPSRGEAATYAETWDRARRLAGVFAAAGLGRGDRIACLLGNQREIYEFYVAASMVGAVIVPINTQTAANEIRRLVSDCGPRGVVASARLLTEIGEDPFGELEVRLSTDGPVAGYTDYAEAISDQAPLKERAPTLRTLA